MSSTMTLATLTPADYNPAVHDNSINDQLGQGKSVNLVGDMKTSPQTAPADQTPATQPSQGAGGWASAFNAVGAVANGVGKAVGQATTPAKQAAAQPQKDQPRPDPMAAVLLAALVNGNKV